MSITAPTPADPQVRIAEIVKKVSTIGTLPEITNQIIRMVEDPKSTASQLHKVISHDPALVTRILKVVNSAFYGLPGQIGSVERAIMMLGLNSVKNLAVAASLGQMFRGKKLCDGFMPKDLWTHCIAVGIAGRDIARQMKLNIADEAFLAGMIHDVGILIAMQVHPEQLREVCEAAKTGVQSFCDLERDIIGVDHQQLGMALAEQWKFPRSCQLVAGYHHRPANFSEQNRLLVTIIYVADTICCQSKYGFNLTALNQRLEETRVDDVKIDPAIIRNTVNNLDELMKTAGILVG
jgi:HD-like signal output (HDOD) protein